MICERAVLSGRIVPMTFWSRSHSLQRKIITAIVMVGLLPLILSLV